MAIIDNNNNNINNNNNNNEFIVRFAVRGQCRGRPNVVRGPNCTAHTAGSIKTQGWGLFRKRSFSQKISPEERMNYGGNEERKGESLNQKEKKQQKKNSEDK